MSAPIAVVTGASRGIGRAIARAFAGHGHDLLLCARDVERLAAATGELAAAHPGLAIEGRAFDLASKQGARGFGAWALERAAARGAAIDVLVNNAGAFVPGDVLDEPDGALEQMLGQNLASAYHVTRVVAPAMVARRRGHIFNLASIAGLRAYPGGGSYSISKFALLGFSKNLRHDLTPHGVKVTAVIPGAVWTDSWSGAGVAEERIMQADDIAALVLAASRLSPSACVEEIVVRPQLGDL